MHGLFTLIKRQIVDNAAFFLVAIIFSVVLVIAIISITFSEELMDLSSYTIILIITAPILFGIGSYILGLVQVHSDKNRGVTAVLSVLPVTPGRILFARLVVGTFIILTLLGPLAITGAVIWKIMGPPEWLFHNWLGDVFIGLALSSLACYCLGLYAARRAGTFASALRGLLLVPIIMLLIVIKGFDRPLLVVLLPFLVVSLFRCWKQDSNRFITNIATGFTVLVLLAIPLYFSRTFCDGLLVRLMDVSAKVSPSGLLPPEIENDPNVESQSEASVSYYGGHYSIIDSFLRSRHDWISDLLEETFSILEPLGISEYFVSRERGECCSYYFRGLLAPTYMVHLEDVEGQLVYRLKYTDSYTDEYTWEWKVATELYVGPKGMSGVPNNKIGRFGSPVTYFGQVGYPVAYLGSMTHRFQSPPSCVVYDANSRCFFAIDFEKQKIYKGPELKDSSIRPIKIGLSAWRHFLRVNFDFPSGMYHLEDSKGSDYLPVLNESGRIDLLDPKTLELHGPAGYLPLPRNPFGWGSEKPRHLLGYAVHLAVVRSNKERLSNDKTKGEYIGLVAGSLSRQGMWTSVAVFDKDGKEIRTADSKSTFFDTPGGPVLTIAKYIFESLHPPVLTLASFFTAYSFEARSAHRALFLMPNSFAAMARDYEGNIFYMSLIVLLLMLPGIVFACILGWRVAQDAVKIGLSRNARRFWLAGMLVFGLPAYITYRLTRSKITFVTCANCGNLRRPDMDICHHCGSEWDVPEPTPPAWRVLDKAEQFRYSPPAEEPMEE